MYILAGSFHLRHYFCLGYQFKLSIGGRLLGFMQGFTHRAGVPFLGRWRKLLIGKFLPN